MAAQYGGRVVVSATPGVAVSIRRTRAVEVALTAASKAIAMPLLVKKVVAELPGSAPESVQGMLLDLLRGGVLVSCLRASSVVVDPMVNLVERGVTDGRSAARTVDLGLAGAVVLPETVADEIENGAALLLRLTRHRRGHPGWQAYHREFLERFGTGARVGLDDLFDPAAGLGIPEHIATGI
ncbi:Lanthionine biosynthesis protein LanB [Pseudonocardia sp. Ae168_Ps1]|nr:Lanthionine biosynthesis protein LanB [Pseudonocardia sp. Ae150A_Ps1]OLL81593.1 Lanthionine biosynthesis protein LanB [Pseudonocardia sp. Ae168_Ps1]OLL84294.1 Lanthionine biosynthesis protein LanB [Pseudonocardia sp. Ae263_Ps1]OLL95687.1 Lanthionine biosynthesis protein LanB [Pseudonocardia sp. Ae356_Ps1]